MYFPGELDRRAVSDSWDRKRRVVQKNRPANTTVYTDVVHPYQSTASPSPIAMKPHTYEQPVIRQCPDCKRLYTNTHPGCPEDTNDSDRYQ